MYHADTAACYGVAMPENMSLNGQMIHCSVFMVFCRGYTSDTTWLIKAAVDSRKNPSTSFVTSVSTQQQSENDNL